MNKVLIVSHSQMTVNFFLEELAYFREIAAVPTAKEARNILQDKDFDLFIINSPLPDQYGDELAVELARERQSIVIQMVKKEEYENVSERVEEFGVIALTKPVKRAFLLNALKISKAAFYKINMIRDENAKLVKKIEDIRLVDRAKCILIEYLRLSETEAHRYIEKRAMDMRISKREIASGIIKTYEY
jgi:response regulator NasT